MNVLLRKILINLSILVFAATFIISYLSGVPILGGFLRASVSLLIIGCLGRFVLMNFLKDIAFALMEYENKKKEEIRNQKMAAQESKEQNSNSQESFFDNENQTAAQENYSEQNDQENDN
ncbi:hypothetical protein J7L67_05810 [bacterium]|nr:hypothetical protein [bacterium]